MHELQQTNQYWTVQIWNHSSRKEHFSKKHVLTVDKLGLFDARLNKGAFLSMLTQVTAARESSCYYIHNNHAGRWTWNSVTHRSHSSTLPLFWLSRMARISCLFSSRYCTVQGRKRISMPIHSSRRLCLSSLTTDGAFTFSSIYC